MALFVKRFEYTTANSYSYSANQKGQALRKVPMILKGPGLQSFMRQVAIIEDHDFPSNFKIL